MKSVSPCSFLGIDFYFCLNFLPCELQMIETQPTELVKVLAWEIRSLLGEFLLWEPLGYGY